MKRLLLVAALVSLSGVAHAGGPEEEFLPGPPEVVVNAVVRPAPLPARTSAFAPPAPAPPSPTSALLIWELRPNATARAGHLGP